MKKSLATLTFTALALAAMAIPSIMNRYSVSAESKLDSAPVASAAAQDFTASSQGSGIVLPNRDIFALNTNNVLMVMRAGATSFTRFCRLDDGNSNFTGMDFRPADGKLYVSTDTGIIYTVALGSANLCALTRVSTMSPRFNSGFQSLMDFNPQADAIRYIGNDNLNYAVAKGANGVLNTTVVQTALSYPAPDVNAGKDPNVASGSYTNNRAGTQVTIFYGMDYALDTFVTIPPPAPGASSATAGGQLQTIGNLVTPAGARINLSPLGDCDVFTNANGVNFLVGVSGRTLFTIDLSQINPAQQRGQTKNVVVRGIMAGDDGSNFCDVAVR